MSVMRLFFVGIMGLILAGFASQAHAAGPVSIVVRGGEAAIVANPPKDFTITVQPKFGRVEKLNPETQGGPFRLRYTPESTTGQRSDTLTYQLQGETTDNVVNISVDPSSVSPVTVGFNGAVYEQSLRAIFLLFILAVILESALALLFNWRPFVENLVPRAVRPVVAFIGALILVRLFDLDVVSTLVNAVNNTRFEVGVPGQVLTAMVIAGGSAGVNTMLVALGFRAVRTPETVAPKPPPDKAWLAIRAKPGQAVGDLLVFVGPPGATNLTLLGVIKGRSERGFLAWFLADRGRLPNYGGHTVQPDQDYLIEVRGKDGEGRPLVPVTLGPLRFARGAVVDLDVTL